MKSINNYITEKFKINSKTINKSDTKDIQLKINREIVDFPDSDLDQIIEFAESLRIRPTEIEYFPNSNALRLGYRYEDSKKMHYCIVFNYLNTNKSKGYRIEYMEDFSNDSYIEYPKFPKSITLKESFEYIENNFDNWIK